MNEKEFNFLNITQYHDSGFYGQGVTIASRESDAARHGGIVNELIRQVAPLATLKTRCDFDKREDFDIYTTSIFFPLDKFKEEKSQELVDKGKLLICAAGNENTRSASALSKFDQWISVGACHLTDKGVIVPSYSSKFKGLDFMSFSNLNVSDKRSRVKGTSYSAPVFAGMCALLQSYYLKTYAKRLSNEELLKIIKANVMDLGTKGYDCNTGYGLFVLPKIN